MDTSKEYIEMCSKAKEIQESWTPTFDDYVLIKKNWEIRYDWPNNNFFVILNAQTGTGFWDTGYYNLFVNKERDIWLPRQDQLQHIITDDIYKLCVGFEIFLRGYPNYSLQPYVKGGADTYTIFSSMEQLWLAFVMKEKWNKVWNGKDWIKCQ